MVKNEKIIKHWKKKTLFSVMKFGWMGKGWMIWKAKTKCCGTSYVKWNGKWIFCIG